MYVGFFMALLRNLIIDAVLSKDSKLPPESTSSTKSHALKNVKLEEEFGEHSVLEP